MHDRPNADHDLQNGSISASFLEAVLCRFSCRSIFTACTHEIGAEFRHFVGDGDELDSTAELHVDVNDD